MTEESNKPIFNARAGRFQVSIWKYDRVIPARDDCGAEREVATQRACVQYSTRNPLTREWKNQNIWCTVDELRSLVQALDQLNNAPDLVVSTVAVSEVIR
jgi:hypothetical protein